MRKILIPTFFLFCSLLSHGQSLTFKDSTIAESGPSITDDIIIHNWFYNNSGKSNLKWRRTQNNLPAGWESAVCDNVQCYGPDISEATFILSNRDSFNFSFHFYANSFRGTGTIKVCVYSVNDTNINTCGTFSVFGWGAGLQSFTNSMSLYPNPANNVVNIDGIIPKSGLIKIIDVTGKLIREQQLESSSNKVNVADIPNGCYLLSLEAVDGFMRQKLFIQH